MESWFFRAYKNRLWKLKQEPPKSHNLPGYSSVLNQSYEIKLPPQTTLGSTILELFSVEN